MAHKIKKTVKWFWIILSWIISLGFLLVVYSSDILSTKYLIPLILIYLSLQFLFCIFLIRKKTHLILRIICYCGSFLLLIGSSISIWYGNKFMNFIDIIDQSEYQSVSYSFIVGKTASAELKNYQDTTVGILQQDEEISQKAIHELEKKVSKLKVKTYASLAELLAGLLNKEVKGIVLENSYKDIIDEAELEENTQIKTIYTFAVKIKVEQISKPVSFSKEPFAVYISGMDSYGAVSVKSRSDVNMVAVVDIQNEKILLISIPRDYYVDLYGKNAKDKLTHAGVYGIDTSVRTIENLLDIDINYYVKINFTSLIEIVDVLGGVTVHSDYAFKAYNGMQFQAGLNKLNGAQALAFSRERKSLPGGDRERGKHQQAVIEAMLKKASSPLILSKYSAILKKMGNSFLTNMESSDITNLIRIQLDKFPKWTIESYSLNGSDAYDYTYTYGSRKLYVMKPNMTTVQTAQKKAHDILMPVSDPK